MLFVKLLVSFFLTAPLVLSEVVTLTSENYAHLVENPDKVSNWLIMFYAPWCEYSKELAPTFEDLADSLDGEVNVGKLDCAVERSLGSKFDVPGFPTIKFIHMGKAYTFKGRRSREELMEFARHGHQIHQPEEIRGSVGLLSDIVHIYNHAKTQAAEDLIEGKFFTIDIYLTFLPIMAIFIIILLLLIPVPQFLGNGKSKRKELAKGKGKGKGNGNKPTLRPPPKSTTTATKLSPFEASGRKVAPPTSKLDSSKFD